MLDLVDTARLGFFVLAGWFALSLVIAVFWAVAGYRLNRRREQSTVALLAAREVKVPSQPRASADDQLAAQVAEAPVAPAIPVHGSRRRRRQDSLKSSA